MTTVSAVQLKGKIPRRTHKVQVAGVAIGGGLPVVVQSMTNTDTADVQSTVAQVLSLAEEGSELVRITVNNEEAAAAVPKIHEALLARHCTVPLVGDFHFNGHELLSRYPACAEALAKFRINPGNVGFGQNKDARFSQIIDIACRFRKPVRIGVNWGSLDQQLLARLMDENSQKHEPQSAQAVMRHAMITSALDSAKRAEELGLAKNAIVLSCKVSGVQDLIHIYRTLSKLSDYPLHLGLTEAGMGSRGITSSASALAVLLQEGIGDTIRVSLTPEPGGDRTQEVRVAQEILQALELRSFSPSITACPGCGRTTSSAFQELAKDVEDYVRERMPHWRRNYVGVENLKLAVMGCVVNGPGESKQANIGISLPGTDEGHKAPVYVNGEKRLTLKGDHLAGDFRKLVEEYVEQHHERRS